ncbi:UDP-N-acetylglucosamine 2-epimerase [Devosia sp. BSSL-BM10]|uniref:UDP-N-acetylglucosamine 2-epimerase n=1 Tax=Devosia litorisediminis TaxID=2829817 RepID=A0A942EH14_9HYPH|nr:UDP-N-acetylglucosamine 2-epimerase [Devosia litorisediminis]MBS3849796.1 UDP-N-acetylglucosamine 2-epimerase [Devosia litorisediminis]
MRKLPEGQIDVLFASYGGGHVAALRPVAQALAREGISVGFLGLSLAQVDLESHGLDYFGFAELEGANSDDVQAWGRELAGPNVPGSPVAYHESVAYHGLNFRDHVTLWGETHAREHYAKHGRQGFLPVQTMEALLRQLQPRLVVATSSPRAEKALFISARKLGIPRVCLVDLFPIQEVEWIAKPGYADILCVLNDQVRDYVIRNGGAPDSVTVTGNPAFDAVNSQHSIVLAKEIRQTRGIAAQSKVILWASNIEPEKHRVTGAVGDPQLPRRIERTLRKMLSFHPDWHLVVRYHPSEFVEFEPARNVHLSSRDENLHALIHSSDLVVVLTSTVGLEAHLAGKSVICVDMSVFTADTPLSKMGIGTGVTCLEQLEPLVEQLLAKEDLPADAKHGIPNACATVSGIILTHLGKMPS